jgi:hypothetical protein
MKKPRKTAAKMPKKLKTAPPATDSKVVQAQNRKLLGKHYASKYRAGKA